MPKSKKQKSEQVEKSIELGGRKLTLSTGGVAEQANAAVMASYGETVVLATVVSSPFKQDLGYFPLTVEYQERLYAGGRIKGSRWVKREGRPSDDEILTARLIDRSIRPLFPKEYKNEVQIIITVLSVDLENTPDIVAATAVSAALAISSIPWKGPIGVVKVGTKDGAYFTNPTDAEVATSELELMVTFADNSVVMIEASSKQVGEEKVLGGIEYAQKEAAKIIKLINELTAEVGKKKVILEKDVKDVSLERKVSKLVGADVKGLVTKMAKKEASYFEYEEMKRAVADELSENDRAKGVNYFEELFKSEARKMLLSAKRPDGRGADDIRDLSIITSVLPRTHGSAIFKRGQTQVLTVITLGSPAMEQLIESAEGEESKRYIHHYSMPPYSVGETGRVGWPSRREIGHGALAEKALIPVIPSEEEFPYTIRVVSEVLSSNGSTSMASTCASSLSLMDAGVPIKKPVAGIAMGLVIEDSKKYAILTDITGFEDNNGDMDFKVSGTDEGITALQLDVKTLNLTLPILKQALTKAKEARLSILSQMVKAIAKPREKVSVYAPKIKVLKIPQDKIGEVIGPGGRVIRGIISETGAQVDIEDSGAVNISGMAEEGVNRALEMVEALIKEAKAGEIYDGQVKRIQPFGAFVEIFPGREGLVHVSDMSEDFVKNPSDIVKIGDKVKVRVKEIDSMGRVNLSMLLSGDKKRTTPEEGRYKPRPRFEHQQGGRRGGRPSGPHFPTSRLMDSSKKGSFGR